LWNLRKIDVFGVVKLCKIDVFGVVKLCLESQSPRNKSPGKGYRHDCHQIQTQALHFWEHAKVVGFDSSNTHGFVYLPAPLVVGLLAWQAVAVQPGIQQQTVRETSDLPGYSRSP
jgi:hypothetical protein